MNNSESALPGPAAGPADAAQQRAQVYRFDGSAWREVSVPRITGWAPGFDTDVIATTSPDDVWIFGLVEIPSSGLPITPFSGTRPMFMRFDGLTPTPRTQSDVFVCGAPS